MICEYVFIEHYFCFRNASTSPFLPVGNGRSQCPRFTLPVVSQQIPPLPAIIGTTTNELENDVRQGHSNREDTLSQIIRLRFLSRRSWQSEIRRRTDGRSERTGMETFVS